MSIETVEYDLLLADDGEVALTLLTDRPPAPTSKAAALVIMEKEAVLSAGGRRFRLPDPPAELADYLARSPEILVMEVCRGRLIRYMARSLTAT